MDKTLRNFLETVNPELLQNAPQDTGDIESPEALRRTHAMTVALLQHAYDLINQAEEKINDQSHRIESLENLALTDELTGLLNRRGFENAMERELERLSRTPGKGSIFALLDLDAFKPINDKYGHQAGDLCLKAVGDALHDIIRATDLAGRLGGDEFALYINDIDPADAEDKINKINAVLNNLSIVFQGETINIRASIGYSNIHEHTAQYDDLFHKADKNMYREKAARYNAPPRLKAILTGVASYASFAEHA